MRRGVAALALVGILALAGCTMPTPGPLRLPAPTASPVDEFLTAQECDRFASAYEEFEAVAHTPDRTEAELLAARDTLLTTWADLAAEAAPGGGMMVEFASMTFEAGLDAGLESARYQEFLDVRDLLLEECKNPAP